MSIPKEPRQMMINMMYLVLTALLALNVSAEILNAFHVVNQGISNSNTAVDSKNTKSMASFQKELEIQGAKVQPFLDKANKVQTIVNTLIKSLEGYKGDIIKACGGWNDKSGVHHDDGAWTPDKGELEDDRNLDGATRVMIEEGNGEKLKKAIEDARNQILALIDDPAMKKQFEGQLPLKIDAPHPTEDNPNPEWVETNFHMVPTIAAMTLLNKFENDAKNSESQILDFLLKSINAKDQKFDKMAAKVIAPTSYIMSGTEYKADIFVAAYNSTANPTVIIGGLNANAKKDENGNYMETKDNPVSGGHNIDVVDGMGKFTTIGGGEGEQHYSGAIMITGPDGTPTYYPFESDYMVAKGSVVISPDNLNLIYAGIDNPFSISVPGFAAENIIATASAGSFSSTGKGKYKINVPQNQVGKDLTISVSVKMQDGTTKPIGSQKFVVKRVPDPKSALNGKTDIESMTTGEIKVTQGIGAVLVDFYFQGIKFTVTSFQAVYIPKRQDYKTFDNKGATWNSTVKGWIDGCHPGDQFVFRQIKASGTDGSTRTLNQIAIQIK